MTEPLAPTSLPRALAAWRGAPFAGAALLAAAVAVPGAAAQDGAAGAPPPDAAVPATDPPEDPPADVGCVDCHRGLYRTELKLPVVELPRSVHGEEEIDCTGCHGGDPELDTIRAHAPSFGFRAAPNAAQTVELCGACHEEHGEAVQEYLGSAHATAAAEGRRGASCFGCHGAHGILRVDDPDSPAHPTHVAETCGGCHADADAMEGSGLPLDQMRQYVTSVHGRAVANGNEDAPSCAGCHDPHEGEAGLAAVSSCGGCHEGPKDAYEAGPHAEAFASRGFLDCVECHGSHEVRRADFTLVASAASSSCRRCHQPGQDTFEDVQVLAALVTEADDAIATSGIEAGPPDEGTEVGRARMALSSAVHALDLEAVRAAVGELKGVLPEPPPESPEPEAIPLARPDPAPAADSAEASCRAGAGVDPRGLAPWALGLFWLAARRRRRGGDS